MSVITAEPAPPIPIPEEEYGLDPSLANTRASADALRDAQIHQDNLTLKLAGLLVGTEVAIARVRREMSRAHGVKQRLLNNKMTVLEQCPGRFVAENEMNEQERELAISLAIGALLKLRSAPHESFDLWNYLGDSMVLETAAQESAA